MPLDAAYQQAVLNSTIESLFLEAGNSFTMLLFSGGVELSGNGYARGVISATTNASDADENGNCTLRLETDDPFEATGSGLSWSQIEIRNSDATEVVFPKFTYPGSISAGERRKVAYVFGLPRQRYLTTQAEIQTALDDDATTGDAVEIASGDIVLTSPIEYGNTTGNTKVCGDLVGRGKGEPYPIAQPNRGNYTNLVVPSTTKTAEQSAILYTRLYSKLRSMLISGKYADQAESVAKLPIGLDMRWVSGGVGKITASDLFFYWMEIGIRLAKNSNELNCDESTWTNLNFRNCDVCVQTNSVQTMGHVFRDMYVGSSDTVFDVHGGGNIKVDNLLIQDSATTIIHHRSDTPNQFGPNNAGWVIDFLKLDSQAVNSVLVEQDVNDGYYSQIEYRNPQFPLVEWTNPAFNLSGRSKTVVRNACFFQADLLSWNSNWAGVVPQFHLDNAVIWPYDSEIQDITDTAKLFNRVLNLSTGDCDIKVTNCQVYEDTTGSGDIVLRPLDDWSARLTGTA
jgi:hypothetical protein